MEGELGSGARIAIALIVIGVIISVIFVILGFTRGTTNQGITTVQNSMDSMSLAQFDDYDQQILSGTQVLSGVKLFEGRPVGTVVRTKLTSPPGAGYNYGAQFTGTSGTPPITIVIPAKAAGNNFYTLDISISTSTGSMSYNMNYLPMKASGTAPYVRPTAKFLSELIKDSTGTIVGICFTQQ
ncbi:hypothetical protein [Cohnella lupini]|uniref:Uncharacterized protein n=1 Tax=Cohnella lupini TaxID=1294267 RepID=A0A3D9HTG5_9BACL|nr:hypothetical protein [Cohnella lupini]RED52803.1 hypothetical protein DFP95_1307 [Cohnella lupini]